VVGFARAIPKAISAVEIFKRRIGVYDQREFKVEQKNTIFKDDTNEAVL
jgi:hypothetical protein